MAKVWSALAILFAAGICGHAADQKMVRYRDFGAVGDGKTDDFAAIVKAHAYANENNLPVKADDDAEYYIGGANLTAIIQTDTDWGRAQFIIDDTKVEKRTAQIFAVTSKLKPFKPEGVTSLRADQPALDIKLPQRCLVIASDDHVKRYIRYGVNANPGAPQTDVFIVDSDGKIDMNAPIIWDFQRITGITAYPIDDATLTISGGRFLTMANRETGSHKYYARGIAINRSNTVADGLEHRIAGEGEASYPYNGFINVGNCANVMIRNCVFTGHRTYKAPNAEGKLITTGTYDITATRAVNVSFINCTQSNDINDTAYWGLMGSNYCKNLLLDRCRFSRFDAHMGVRGAIIRNSTLGHAGINAIGSGTFLLENSTVCGRSLITLRSDYGSTWRGDFIIRNCVFIPANGRSTAPALFSGHYDGSHDFGYTCYMPAHIVIENLEIRDADTPKNYAGPALFSDFNPKNRDASYVEKFPYVKTRTVTVRNLKSTSGKPLRVSDNPYMFREVKVVESKGAENLAAGDLSR